MYLRSIRAQSDALAIEWNWFMNTLEINGIHIISYESGLKSFPADGLGLWW